MRTSTEQRRERIISDICRTGQVTVETLATSLGASPSTIRRDLRALAKTGALKLIYGGALLAQRYELSFEARCMCNVEAKNTVGRLAAGLVRAGDLIFVDAGTTTVRMAPLLRIKHGVTVIAQSARFVRAMESCDAEVILLGGKYRADIEDLVGPMTVASLEPFHNYTAFLGASAVNMDFGAAVADIESAHVAAAAVRNAARVVLLVDSTKFDRRCFFKIAGFERISTIVTEKTPPREWLDFLTGRGVGVITPQGRASAARDGARVAGYAGQ